MNRLNYCNALFHAKQSSLILVSYILAFLIYNLFLILFPGLTCTVKVRPPTRSLASRTTGLSPLAFNSFAALKPADRKRNTRVSEDTCSTLPTLHNRQDKTCILIVHECQVLVYNDVCLKYEICETVGECFL